MAPPCAGRAGGVSWTSAPSMDHQGGAVGVAQHPRGDRAQQPAPDGRPAAAAHDDEVGAEALRGAQDLVRRVAFEDLGLQRQAALGGSLRQLLELVAEMLLPLFDDGVELDAGGGLGEPHDRADAQLGAEADGDLERALECQARWLGAVVGHCDLVEHGASPCQAPAAAGGPDDGAGGAAGGEGSGAGAGSAAGSRWRGRKKRLAIIVGTTALAMTAATRKLYWAWSMMPWLSPKRAEIVPKVSPVDISSV